MRSPRPDSVSSGGNADASPTTYTTPARKFELRRIPAKVELDGAIAQNVSMINDIFEEQIQAKQIAMWNAVSEALITGDNVTPNPAGLEFFAAEHPGGVLPGGGVAISLTMLDDMIQAVRPGDGSQPRVFVVNRFQYAKLCQAARSDGFMLCCKPDPVLRRDVLTYASVPILVSDFISNDEGGAGTTSAYLVHLGPREGEPQYGGLVWFYNEDTGAGIRVDGPHRTSGAEDLLYIDLDLNIGFATLSTGGRGSHEQHPRVAERSLGCSNEASCLAVSPSPRPLRVRARVGRTSRQTTPGSPEARVTHRWMSACPPSRLCMGAKWRRYPSSRRQSSRGVLRRMRCTPER